MAPSLIFDFDGTLVDSSSGIICSLLYAFAEAKISTTVPLTPALIGPPLPDTLRLLCSNPDETTLDLLTSSFKAHYDSIGFYQTIPFPGVDQMLHSLVAAKIPLYIATNKRQQPTSQILDLLTWTPLFDLVLSPDSFNQVLPSKAAILSKLLAKANLDAKECLYIGDRLGDYNAAMEIGIPFALAEWGFEGDGSDFPPQTMRMQSLNADQLMAHFNDQANH